MSQSHSSSADNGSFLHAQPVDYAVTLNGDSTIAALVCGEFLEHPKLDGEFIDRELLDALRDNLIELGLVKDQSVAQRLASDLLPWSKKVLEEFYRRSRNAVYDFEDITATAHDECDIELLRHAAHIFTRQFLSQHKELLVKQTKE